MVRQAEKTSLQNTGFSAKSIAGRCGSVHNVRPLAIDISRI